MKRNEIIDKFTNVILANKGKLVFGPSDFEKEIGIHFNTSKNLVEDFSAFLDISNKLRDEGVELIGGKTPKGTPRLMIVPTKEKQKEMEELEIKFGFETGEKILEKKKRKKETKSGIKKNILIIDDHQNFAKSLEKWLNKTYPGYSATSVYDKNECLTLLQYHEIPDLILLDIMMPEMNGWDMFDKLKTNPKWNAIPIVFLTSRTDRLFDEKCGFINEDNIEKPCNIPELKERLDEILKISL